VSKNTSSSDACCVQAVCIKQEPQCRKHLPCSVRKFAFSVYNVQLQTTEGQVIFRVLILLHLSSSHRYRMTVEFSSHRYRMTVESSSHRYRMTVVFSSHRYRMTIVFSSHRYRMTVEFSSHRYRMIVEFSSHRYRLTVIFSMAIIKNVNLIKFSY
jgi:hypothetical protein